MKISIITVCYNAGKTIEACVQSVLDQTYPGIEYIIVDGGSSDETLGIIKRHGDRIQKVISEKDNGIYDAMNKGLAHATGDVIYFLNADDRFCGPEVVAQAAGQFQDDGRAQIVYGKVKFVNVPVNLNLDKNYVFAYKNRWHMLTQVHPQQCYFVRRTVFERTGVFDTGLKICADYDWFLRAQNEGVVMRFFNKDIAFYDAQGRSFQRRYEVILEKIKVVYKNASFLEFMGYFLFASTRKLRDICVESLSLITRRPL